MGFINMLPEQLKTQGWTVDSAETMAVAVAFTVWTLSLTLLEIKDEIRIKKSYAEKNLGFQMWAFKNRG